MRITKKRVLVDRITPQYRPIDVLITAIHELHLQNIFEMVDTISNMQLSDPTPIPMVEKVSVISLNTPLDPASTLLQGYNTTKSSAFTGFMDSPTSMINTARMMK